MGKTSSTHTAMEIELITAIQDRQYFVNVSFMCCIHKNN